MNEVNKTLYIPLYGKSYVSKRGIILDDKKAEEIWASEGFLLKGKSKSKWLAYYMGMRAAVFDEWVRQQIINDQSAVVLHIGCGLDSRVLRVNPADHKWYDVDFPQVIEERRRYYRESAGYQMLAADVRDCSWLDSVPERSCASVVMEGVSMYIAPNELQALIASLCAHFDHISLLMDCYTVFGAKMSKIKNPIQDVGITQIFGMDDPKLLQQGKFAYIREHSMTPRKYIDALTGMEKHIFNKLYAGSFSKKLYRLYEFRSDIHTTE